MYCANIAIQLIENNTSGVKNETSIGDGIGGQGGGTAPPLFRCF